MQTLWQDLRYGARMLARQPGFTLVTVLTLALGIGANTAIFSVIHGLVIEEPNLADAERVAAIWRTPKDKRVEGFVSYLELQDWAANLKSFESIAGYKPHGFVVIGKEEAGYVPGLRVTAGFLSLLKVQVSAGRDFTLGDELAGAEPVALVSHRFWQDRLGGADSAIGSRITLDGRAFSVIGVLPPDFEFPLVTARPDIVATVAGESGNLGERGAQVLRAVGRLNPGVELTEAQAEIAQLAASLEAEYPEYSRDTTIYALRVSEQLVGPDVRRALWLLLGAVNFLLLIACTNVTNLLLVRSSARQKELALRFALGAGAWRIARQMLTESLLLVALAGGAGLLVAVWGLGALRYYGDGQLPRLDDVSVNGPVLAFTAGVSILTALLFSVLPVVRASRPDLNEVLKAGSRTATSGEAVRIWRDSLVVTEVALGLVLLVCAGLMIRSFDRLVGVDPGFDPNNVLTGQISLTDDRYAEHDERARYVDGVLERLAALPGVESAAFIAPMPFSGGNVSGDFRIDGRPAPEPGTEPVASVRSVTPGYFDSMRIRLVGGRYFTDQDRRGQIGAAVVNESLARRYFPGENPVGKRITSIGANQNDGDPVTWEIVGIAGDVRHSSLTKGAQPEIYLPYQANSWPWGNFFVRASSDPASLTHGFTAAICHDDRTVVVTNVRPLAEAISNTVAEARFYTFLFTLFGLTGLILTLTGIYGVLSYSVTQSTPEIGIRMALGAGAWDVLRLFLGRGMLLAMTGILMGVVASLGVTRLMSAMLFGVDAADPATFVAIVLLMGVVTLLACYVPSRRATKVDPLAALKYE